MTTFYECIMKDPLDKIKEVIKKNKNIAFCYLFGSRAKGFAGAESDWDLAVYFDVKELKRWSRFWLEAEIEREINKNVQVIVLNTIENPVFGFEIISCGNVIVDKNPEARILFETSVLRSYHDWNYFLERHMALK